MIRSRLFFIVCVIAGVVTLITLTPTGCFHSSSGSGSVLNMVIGSQGQDISLNSGQTTEIVTPLSYDVQNLGGPFESVSLNLQAHLSALEITLPGQVTSKTDRSRNEPVQAITPGAHMYIRVAHREAADSVCSDGELYGPFSVSIDESFAAAAVTPASQQASQTTLDVINTGSLSICVQVVAMIDATVDLNRLAIEKADCASTPANIHGTWTGTYSCDGNCPAPPGTPVSLDISQSSEDPYVATYTDTTGATYSGTVCGNRFSYKGGVSNNYDESGTFVLNADGVTATKTSTYTDVPPNNCTGTCTDELTRAP